MAVILGMCLAHDGSIALVKDGRLTAAISRERLSRRKKDAGVSLTEINYVLDAAGVSLDAVDAVAFTSFHYDENSSVKIYRKNGEEIRHDVYDLPPGAYAFECVMEIGGRRIKSYLVHHHLSHCASTFYTSNFEKAAAFSVDSSLDRPEACSLFAYGDGLRLFPLFCPGVMIGNAYYYFTDFLGIGNGLYKAGSTMGLAAYGSPSERARNRWRDYGRSFYERPAQPDDKTFIELMWSDLSGLPPHARLAHVSSDSKQAMDIAASLQFVFEENLIETTEKLYGLTETFNGGNLCLAGGSFLNCNTNAAITRRTSFKNVHLFPGCGDDGTAVGAALYVAHHMMGEPRVRYELGDIAYLGRSYPDPDWGEPLDTDVVVEALADGKVVAWFQGRSEFGPRALGNRSILADPRSPTMRDHINFKVKHREWYRPFAPMVRAENLTDWFKFDRPSPYMLFTADVREPERLPAICHVDGTARIQTVTADSNPGIYELLTKFNALTGVPILLNTSLNGNGEPLLETPEDALRFWNTGVVDMLVVGGRMLRK